MLQRLIGVFSAVILICCNQYCVAENLEHEDWPKTVQVANQNLVLNGVGLRSLTFFKIQIYFLGLYLREHSQDPQSILASTSDKMLLLKFVRSVGKERLYYAVEDSVKDNYPEWQKLHRELSMLKEIMPDIKAGDKIEFILTSQTVQVRHNNFKEVLIPSQEFQKAILSIWLGPEPAGIDLKKSLLTGQ